MFNLTGGEEMIENQEINEDFDEEEILGDEEIEEEIDSELTPQEEEAALQGATIKIKDVRTHTPPRTHTHTHRFITRN